MSKNSTTPLKSIWLASILVAAALCLHAQWNTSDPRTGWFDGRPRKMNSATPAYRKEAVRLIIEEANRVAQDMGLPEKLPITDEDVISTFVSSPQMSEMLGTFGNITTSNYIYYVSIGNKFSFLERAHLLDEDEQLRAAYRWPMSRMDTNAAYQLATQFLSAASMDVKALNRDCDVHIDAVMPKGKNGAEFVPVYWVCWTKGNESGTVAGVEVFQPSKTLLQMHVKKTEYILRKPLAITNVDFLLSQTNNPAMPIIPAENHK